MGKLLRKIIILAGIFTAAVGIGFILTKNTTKKEETVYSTMEEATLPVLFTDVLGVEQNRLPGYRQEMGQIMARDSLTVIPEDRKLKLRIAGYGKSPLAISYEIRSMDLNRLVERTEISDWTSGEETELTLPIQNLLTKGTEYLLRITVTTQEHGEVYYYTRIMLPENDYAKEMLAFGRGFSEKTLDTEQAKSLAVYLETNSAEDNSSLGRVTIRSSFSQLTWAGLTMQLLGTMEVTMKELDGIMGQVQVQYQLTREAEDGAAELYDVVDYYTLKWNVQRIYLMDFERTVNQVFQGSRELYSGKRIMLGVGNDSAIQVKSSPDKKQLAFTFNKDLWGFDQVDGKAVKIFSFRSSEDISGRSSYNQNDREILAVRDNGDVDFLVYGYMNRGKREGYMGVSLYRYEQSSGTIQERFFVPVLKTYEGLKQDLKRLTYLSSSDMLYIMIDSAIYGIDLTSNEYMVVADALQEGSYAVSEDKNNVAWQEGTELYQSSNIHLLNLETGLKQEIASPDGSYLRTLGFVREDFVYGMANSDDLWTVNGRVEELPMYALEIVSEDLSTETRYEKPGLYLANATVEGVRVNVMRLAKSQDGQYIAQDEDTIVCNTVSEGDALSGVGWYASETRRKLYFVQLSYEIKSGKNIKISVPKKITYDTSDVLTLKANRQTQGMMFYAYGQGHLQGSSKDFAQAVQMAYDVMGIVVNTNQEILWDRVNRSSAKNIRDPQNAALPLLRHLDEFTGNKNFGDGALILDARGCTMSQMLYFVDKGWPVLAYVEDGNYVLLQGFDQYNVSLFNPATGQSYKMGLNDGNEYFNKLKNDFISWIPMD